MDKNAMMQTLARAAYEKGCFNGVWLYAENGRIVSKGAYGFRDPENRLPMQEDSVFEIASVSKQFTATAILLLVRQGKLRLDDEITAFFPELGAYTGVTVRHLLTHTGGVPDHYDDNDFAAWFVKAWAAEKRIPSNGDALRFLTQSGAAPVGAPGERYEYSNTGYNLLAELVERLSGVPFEDFVKKNVFAPAGMDDTAILHTRRDGRPSERIARNMVMEDGVLVPSDLSRAAGYVVGSDGLNGCDYAYTTVFDMLKWDRALRAGSVVTLEEQKIMYTTVRLNSGEDFYDEDGDGYGFGWGVRHDEEHGFVVSHSGGMPGLNTWFERYLDEDRVLLIFINRDPEDYRALAGVWDGLRAIARDEEPDPIVSLDDIMVRDPDRSGWAGFCGRYEHPEDDDFILEEVRMQDGELYAKAINDGDEMEFRLYPIGENKFGRKGGMIELTFGDGCVTYSGVTCRKL